MTWRARPAVARQARRQKVHLVGEDFSRRKNEVLPAARGVGDEQQLHSTGFLRPPATLLLIAAAAGGNDVAPTVRATLNAWNHVVPAQFPGRKLLAAVSTGVSIPAKKQGIGERQFVALPVPGQAATEGDDRMHFDR